MIKNFLKRDRYGLSPRSEHCGCRDNATPKGSHLGFDIAKELDIVEGMNGAPSTTIGGGGIARNGVFEMRSGL